ncbi:unnamed protein product [Effrenium voratum]|nr:unnamed protein product [Effrenium voratum]
MGGRDLQPLPAELQREPTRGLAWRLAVARQLCLAVDALHRSGRSHGSLAPRNVLVADGDICLMEAGLTGALLEVGALREHELLGALGLGFARYLAPEGWHARPPRGAKADIFSLGLILMEVLAGSRPNPECKSLQQLSAKLLPKRGCWQPQVRCSELPEVARRAIESCFHQDPEMRPSAQELLFSLAAPEEGIAISKVFSVSEGLKSGSTGISGSSQSQDFDDLAEVAEEPTLTTHTTRAPRHMSWPTAPKPSVEAPPEEKPRRRPFSADDVELLRPLWGAPKRRAAG